MDLLRQGRMSKIAISLLLLSLALGVMFIGHGIATGVGVPYPDPTPAQRAFEQFHRPISMLLMLAMAVSFVGGALCGFVWMCFRLLGGGSHEQG